MLPPKPTKCQNCGRVADVAQVTFRKNIGMLFMRRTSSMKASLCKSCIQETYLSYNVTLLFLGWWGTISFFLTPTFLILNTIALTKSFGLASPGGGTAKEQVKPQKLTPKLMDKIEPHTREIITRLKANEPIDPVANNIAIKAGVTPEDVKLYVSELVRVAKKKKQQAA